MSQPPNLFEQLSSCLISFPNSSTYFLLDNAVPIFPRLFHRVAWKTKCQGDLSKFIEGCRLDSKPGSSESEKNRRPENNSNPKRPNKNGFLPGILSPMI